MCVLSIFPIENFFLAACVLVLVLFSFCFVLFCFVLLINLQEYKLPLFSRNLNFLIFLSYYQQSNSVFSLLSPTPKIKLENNRKNDLKKICCFKILCHTNIQRNSILFANAMELMFLEDPKRG